MHLHETSIAGRTQITRLLNHLQDLQCPLVLSQDEADCCRTGILAINPDDNYLLLEGVPLPQSRKLLAPQQRVDVRAQFHGEEARFSSHVIEAADLAGKALLRIKLPESIDYQQRRAHFRVPVEYDAPINVTLIHEEHGSHVGVLEDISLGGIAVRVAANANNDKPTAELCLIQLPDGELFHIELEISNVRPTGEGEMRIGARFRTLTEPQHRKLERFIRRLERELLKRRRD